MLLSAVFKAGAEHGNSFPVLLLNPGFRLSASHSLRQMARPIPEELPVTMAVLPLRLSKLCRDVKSCFMPDSGRIYLVILGIENYKRYK